MGLLSRLTKRDDARREPVPFVVGMNRSGTTLLRMMLDAHPDLTIPPETHFVPDLIKAAREDDATPESALEAMKSAREWGDFGFTDEEMLARLRALAEDQAGPGRAHLLRRLHRAAGQAALGREDAHLRAEDEADPARARPRRASST